MEFQQLLDQRKPYTVFVKNLSDFGIHCHYEVEILYCIHGCFTCIQDGVAYTVGSDEFIVIQSMVLHEIKADKTAQILVVEIGPVLLKEKYRQLSDCNFYPSPYRINETVPYLAELKTRFLQLADTWNDASCELLHYAALYGICFTLIHDLPQHEPTDHSRKRSIENALELVYYHASEPIDIDRAAAVCGFGKSSFCRIFKETVGEGFHSYLNGVRIRNACNLLQWDDHSIKEIAERTGFPEEKTFCRVFRAKMGMTAIEYRRSLLSG